MDRVRGVEPNRVTVRICDDDGEPNNVCTFMFYLCHCILELNA